MNTEHVENICLVAARGTKENLRKQVVMKHGSYVDEILMTQSISLVLQRRKLFELGGAHLNELREV